MQCNCGGSTADHEVIRNKIAVAEFRRCRACGRMYWLWGEQELRTFEREEAETQAGELDLGCCG